MAQRRAVIHGMAGSGKSQLAAMYATNNRVSYSAVFSVDCSSDKSLKEGYESIHKLLGLPDSSDRVNAVKGWLDQRQLGQHWLLIFDNVPAKFQLDQYLPTISRVGHILLLSRSSSISEHIHCGNGVEIEVEGLSQADAKSLLISRSRIKGNLSVDQDTFAVQIVQVLGYLPSAIAQAGAYMHTNSLSIEVLATTIQKELDKILQYKSLYSKYPPSLYVAVDDALKQLEEASFTTAEQFLLFLCHLDPILIGRDLLLSAGQSRSRRTAAGGVLQRSPVESGVSNDIIHDKNGLTLDQRLQLLISHSLIQRIPKRPKLASPQAFAIHPLVEFCMKQRTSETARRRAIQDVISFISHVYPDGSESSG